jgi:hypothetical protein
LTALEDRTAVSSQVDPRDVFALEFRAMSSKWFVSVVMGANWQPWLRWWRLAESGVLAGSGDDRFVVDVDTGQGRPLKSLLTALGETQFTCKHERTSRPSCSMYKKDTICMMSQL